MDNKDKESINNNNNVKPKNNNNAKPKNNNNAKPKNNNNATTENKINLLLKRNQNSKEDIEPNKPRINRTVLLILLGLIIVGGIVLFLFIFYKKDKETYKVGYSYSPKDITNIDINPPIDKKVENINQCIDECNLNGNCNGVTFNKDTYRCKGYKNGMLVKSTPTMNAWEKPKDKKTKESEIILLTKTYQQTSVDAGRMPFPYEVYNFNFSFWLKIIDWYNSTHSYWKCVFFKSSTDHLNNRYNKVIKTSNWEDIVNELPDQCIGVWLSPFTNNLRICLSTEKIMNDNKISFPHPNKQICVNNSCLYTNDLSTKQIDGDEYKEHIQIMKKYLAENKEKKTNKPKTQGYIPIKTNVKDKDKQQIMEHFDILNIPIGESFFISVNVNKTIMEIYINDKLNYIVNLEGKAICNTNQLNVKNQPTFNGNLYNISYLPYFSSFKEIQDLYKIDKPKD
jgi:hypothetical protein